MGQAITHIIGLDALETALVRLSLLAADFDLPLKMGRGQQEAAETEVSAPRCSLEACSRAPGPDVCGCSSFCGISS